MTAAIDSIAGPLKQYWTGARTSVEPSGEQNKESLDKFNAGNFGPLVEILVRIILASFTHTTLKHAKRSLLLVYKKKWLVGPSKSSFGMTMTIQKGELSQTEALYQHLSNAKKHIPSNGHSDF